MAGRHVVLCLPAIAGRLLPTTVGMVSVFADLLFFLMRRFLPAQIVPCLSAVCMEPFFADFCPSWSGVFLPK